MKHTSWFPISACLQDDCEKFPFPNDERDFSLPEHLLPDRTQLINEGWKNSVHEGLYLGSKNFVDCAPILTNAIQQVLMFPYTVDEMLEPLPIGTPISWNILQARPKYMGGRITKSHFGVAVFVCHLFSCCHLFCVLLSFVHAQYVLYWMSYLYTRCPISGSESAILSSTTISRKWFKYSPSFYHKN